MRRTEVPSIPQHNVSRELRGVPLFDLTDLSLELILVVLDQVVENGEGLSPLGVSRLRAGIASALGGDAPPMDLVSGLRDATADLAAGMSPEDVRQTRNALAGVLGSSFITLF